MIKPTLIVMAAGMGSRYGGLKQLDPVGPNGEIILDYSVYDALRAGFGKVVFVIKEEFEQTFRGQVGTTIGKHCETAYVFQKIQDVPPDFVIPPDRKKPWGTGHAVLSCKDVVHTPFAVINADDFYGRASYQVLCDYLKNAQDRAEVYDYCMVGFVLENTLTEHGHVARGVCSLDEKGFLIGIRERTRVERFENAVRYTEDGETWVEIPNNTIASLNMGGFTPSFFAELEAHFRSFLQENGHNIKAELFLPAVVGSLIKAKKARVQVLATSERWFGVTYQQDKPRVKQAIQDLIRRGDYPERLWG